MKTVCCLDRVRKREGEARTHLTGRSSQVTFRSWLTPWSILTLQELGGETSDFNSHRLMFSYMASQLARFQCPVLYRIIIYDVPCYPIRFWTAFLYWKLQNLLSFLSMSLGRSGTLKAVKPNRDQSCFVMHDITLLLVQPTILDRPECIWVSECQLFFIV